MKLFLVYLAVLGFTIGLGISLTACQDSPSNGGTPVIIKSKAPTLDIKKPKHCHFIDPGCY